MRWLASALVTLSVASSALAQDSNTGRVSGQGYSTTMADLLSKGYEIKAAVPNGSTKLIVFLQKGTSAYACEFVHATKTRCGSVN